MQVFETLPSLWRHKHHSLVVTILVILLIFLFQAESEHEERYFSALEKKEQMEDKMGAIMEVPVKLFVCLQVILCCLF